MKILYKQPVAENGGSLCRFGIQNGYFKQLLLNGDVNDRSVTKKTHHHTGYELHLIVSGRQEYRVGERIYTVNGGEWLLLCPNTPHTVVAMAPYTQKYSFTFTWQGELKVPCFFHAASARLLDTVALVAEEAARRREISPVLVENGMLEVLVTVLRLAGAEENAQSILPQENAVVALAKQYIDDNVERAPTVSEVSAYCQLSTKQLTRLFGTFAGISPGEYILRKRVTRIEQLLTEGALPLKTISERMGFSSEYYFNVFFKTHAGMPPGEYRKMQGK